MGIISFILVPTLAYVLGNIFYNFRHDVNSRRSTWGSDYSFLIMDGAHVYLQGEVKCDAVAFMEKIQEAQHETSVDTKQDLIDQLLNNLPKRLFEPLDIDWFLQLKTQIEEDLIDLVLWNANRYKKQNDYLTAIRQLKKTVILAPSIDLYECLIDLYGKAEKEEQAIIWHSRMLEYDGS